jgi:hypothetical protein
MRRWHWISAAVCLAAVLLFSVTGITLNHAASISSSPAVTSRDATLPVALLDELVTAEHGRTTPLPLTARMWLRRELGIEVGGRPAEWSPSEIYVSMPEPGADAWLAIERDTGAIHYEHTDRGWISFFNDGRAPLGELMPGRYTLVVEAVRESGGREAVRIPLEWPATARETLTATGAHELGAVVVTIGP